MLKFYLGEHGSVLPLVVLVVGLAAFALIAVYVATDARAGHRRRMEALPLEGDPADA